MKCKRINTYGYCETHPGFRGHEVKGVFRCRRAVLAADVLIDTPEERRAVMAARLKRETLSVAQLQAATDTRVIERDNEIMHQVRCATWVLSGSGVCHLPTGTDGYVDDNHTAVLQCKGVELRFCPGCAIRLHAAGVRLHRLRRAVRHCEDCGTIAA